MECCLLDLGVVVPKYEHGTVGTWPAAHCSCLQHENQEENLVSVVEFWRLLNTSYRQTERAEIQLRL